MSPCFQQPVSCDVLVFLLIIYFLPQNALQVYIEMTEER